MHVRAPIEILGAIIDEVEGLRRTDARSHLPEFLLREARAALEEGLGSSGKSGGSQLDHLDSLVGRTVSHVFEGDLKRAQAVIACSDGSFLALETERDGDESYIVANSPRTWGPPSNGLADFLWPKDLVDAGLMTKEEQQRLDREAKEAQLAALKERTEAQMARLRAELADLENARPNPLPC